MNELFNDYVQSLETYIMFKIGEDVAKLKPELVAKGRSPISLSMGAPVKNPLQFVIDKLKEALMFEDDEVEEPEDEGSEEDKKEDEDELKEALGLI